MNLTDFTFQSIRFLLLPIAFIYWMAIWVRNKLYDINVLKSTRFNLPLICVGNLSVGGTGKSTMVEYLLGLLSRDFNTATLSRGYKRKTRGYILANENTGPLEIGDEPHLFHLKFPNVPVAVGEERLVAIPQLLQDRPETRVIVLDDAFQHRAVEAGLNILLTDYSNLFTRDFYLPTGDLRDLKSRSKRASIIMVTKCPSNLQEEERKSIKEEIRPLPDQHLFFSCIEYGKPYHLLHHNEISFSRELEVLLVTGIANPKPLKNLLTNTVGFYDTLSFSDHHIFTIDDLREIKNRFKRIDSTSKIILTTEKDAVRLIKFREELMNIPIFVIPIRQKILFGEEPVFNGLIINFVRNFNRKNKE
ncbi:MAG TPA: tetraacyldisaccharide 4'-kinase [Chitinophagaceae bacterium]|nr:tetraacyldisaccharide 4'-kinase [Chitinophagaceae bacterium]